MKNLSHHTGLLCAVVTSLLIRVNQTGEMSKLGWLTGFTEHAIWADFLYFLCLLLLSIPNILVSSQTTL
jgi:ABC-type Fe3+-siderophore transport system permease subunit